MASKQLYLGSPIESTLVATTVGFSFNDYINIFIYLYTGGKVIKMSVLEKDGYLPLTIISDTQMKIEVAGNITKTMVKGEIMFEMFDDNMNPMDDLLGGTLFGIEMVDNKIKAEVL